MRLTVTAFSCIESAELEFGDLTILVGPQASGKSVLCKLTYFFLSLLRDQFTLIEEQKKLDAMKAHIREKFVEWFPLGAWGKNKFCIEFEAGKFQVRLTRGGYRGKVGDTIRISISPFFEENYKSMSDSYEGALQKASNKNPREDYELMWRIQRVSEQNLKKALGRDYFRFQMFVPAGRSFFTSIGKAVVAFEQGRVLDPLTSQFGRFFASMRERQFVRFRGEKSGSLEIQVMQQIFGGKLKFERDVALFETDDGRKIPFSALSSGQQELLPLLLTLGWMVDRELIKSRGKQLLYIEELEAHLFPSAQSVLVELLASVVASPRGATDMVLTTHSPYVLAKLNNLLKAGALAARLGESKSAKVNAVVPRRAWLKPSRVRAYAIKDRKLHSIMDDDGLIDADYLDDVSGSISREFSALLEIEASR